MAPHVKEKSDLTARRLATPRGHSKKLNAAPAGSRADLIEDISAIGRAIPVEVWAEIPKDFSVNHDHYLYGYPKAEK